MRRAWLVLPWIAVLAICRAVGAQVELVGDLGVSHLRQTGIPEANAGTFGATLDAAAEHAFLRATALGARAAGDRSTGQLMGLFAVIDPSTRLLRWELDGTATAFGETGALPTSTGELAGRLRVGGNALGVALGASAGAAAHLGEASPIARALASGWWSAGAERFGLDMAVTHARLRQPLVGFPQATIISQDVSYGEAAAGWRHEADAISLGATAGLRGFASGPVPSGGWFSADAALWVSRRTGLVISAGRTLEDVVRGFPRAAYASIALRISSRPHLALGQPRAMSGPTILARRSTSGQVLLVVRAPGASEVEVMADFTDWAPVALARAGEIWRLEHPATPGAHRVAVRVDGGAWRVPANLPAVSDDLGGAVGIISIP